MDQRVVIHHKGLLPFAPEVGILEDEWNMIEVPSVRKRYTIDNPHSVLINDKEITIRGFSSDKVTGIEEFEHTYRIDACKFYKR